MMDMKIASNGAWLNETNEGHRFDESLARAIVKFCEVFYLKTILDLGCGDGSYVRHFNENVSLFAIGIDGNPFTTEVANNIFCIHENLNEPLQFSPGAADLIISLEVGEHIPAEYEGIFLDNVVKYANDWIILSWAIPGQPGDGHVNCRDNEWVYARMRERGFRPVQGLISTLRDEATLFWFKETLMAFKRISTKPEL